MCDTIYVAGDATTGAGAYFAKNSDRKPGEPQAFFMVPQRATSESSTISGGRTVKIAHRGYAYCLSRPSWMWGGEMGINIHGVAIGNEAVFSRMAVDKDGILGMDILRLALQSSRTAEEAGSFIAEFIEQYGQGGNGAYRGSLYYHNSFLICDRDGAVVLETAGRQWAMRRAAGIATISNAYSIDTDYDSCDRVTSQRLGGGRSWKAVVERKLHTALSRGNARMCASREYLRRQHGGIDVKTVFGLLRYHNSYDPQRPRRKSMESICIHPGGLLNSATTASMVVEYPAEEPAKPVIWYTGTAIPCLSLFKPVLVDGGRFIPLLPERVHSESDSSAFRRWNEHLHVVADGNERRPRLRIRADADFVNERERIQRTLVELAARYSSEDHGATVAAAKEAADEFDRLLEGAAAAGAC